MFSYGKNVTYACNPLGSVICGSVYLRYNVCIHTVEDLPGCTKHSERFDGDRAVHQPTG